MLDLDTDRLRRAGFSERGINFLITGELDDDAINVEPVEVPPHIKEKAMASFRRVFYGEEPNQRLKSGPQSKSSEGTRGSGKTGE